MGDRRKETVTQEDTLVRRDVLFPERLQISDEIVKKAHKRAPNTIKGGFLGFIGGALLGGPWVALLLGTMGGLIGACIDDAGETNKI